MMRKITKTIFASIILAGLFDVNFLVATDCMTVRFQNQDDVVVAKALEVQIDHQKLNVEILNTMGDGDCTLRAMAPDRIWRAAVGTCRAWAGRLLMANLEDPFVVKSLVTEIEYRKKSNQLPVDVEQKLMENAQAELSSREILSLYIHEFVVPTTNDYLQKNPGLEANYLEFPSEELKFSAITALTHIMNKRLVIIENQEGFVIYDDADIANIPGTEEEKQIELMKRMKLPFLIIAQDACAEGINLQDSTEVMQTLTQHDFRVRIVSQTAITEPPAVIVADTKSLGDSDSTTTLEEEEDEVALALIMNS